MITPKFSLDQDDNQLVITVHAPYTNIKETEIHVHENDVRFYSAPYYLRLTLPGNVEETDNSSAKYISDESKFVIRLDKMTPGEFFPDLDMITSFLQPKENKKRSRPLIEVVDDGESASSCGVQEELDEEEWFIEQAIEEEMPSQLVPQNEYGFGNNHKGLGSKYEVELAEIAEIKNPDSLSPVERHKLKAELEQEKFSDDHYLSDLLLENEIPGLLEFKFETSSLKRLTNKNLGQMKDLGNREFLLDKLWLKRTHLGLLDILFAYCYDWRTTEGSHCVESPWNISRMSGTLSWFVTFDTIKELVLSCMRRSLSYPLHRNWDLSMQVFKDVKKVLKSGPTGILVCLLDIHNMFCQRDPYYLQNQLYIEDYCVWVQKLQATNLSSILSAFDKTLKTTDKSQVGFDLCELELAAKLVEEEEMEEELAVDVGKMNL